MPADTGTVPDTDVLGRWLDTKSAPGQGEEPRLELLTGGSQNTLYLVHRGDQRMVLRMPGPRADAARLDGLLREIRLVRGLAGTDVPHAELIAADDTGDVLGKPFYVMAEIDGTLFLFYSGNDWATANYAIGYAVCETVTGPCTKPLDQPLHASTADAKGPGGQTVVIGGDTVALGYHAWLPGKVDTRTGQRRLYLGEVTVANGLVTFDPYEGG